HCPPWMPGCCAQTQQKQRRAPHAPPTISNPIASRDVNKAAVAPDIEDMVQELEDAYGLLAIEEAWLSASDQKLGKDGSGKDGTGKDGTGKDGSGKDATGKDGTVKDGTGKDGTGKDGTGKAGTGKDGTGKDGEEVDNRQDEACTSPVRCSDVDVANCSPTSGSKQPEEEPGAECLEDPGPCTEGEREADECEAADSGPRLFHISEVLDLCSDSTDEPCLQAETPAEVPNRSSEKTVRSKAASRRGRAGRAEMLLW
ncbi:unnamed protein product, partial [Effrenium voratum]